MKNKYIDSEKLIAEVERLQRLLKSPLCECLTDDYKAGGIKQLDLLLSFIISLQQEQTEVDLEKEIDNFLNETGAPYMWCNDDEQKEWCNIIACHFYELGLNARKEK